jgi:acetylornithine deacetylase/succinyl-diaminopimelate desuccinylase-like protein
VTGSTDGWDVLDLARLLVRTPSPNPVGDERAVAGVVTDVLRDLGLPAPTVLAKSPERPNLVCTVDLGPGGSHLVLSGHLDTKPVGDASWSRDPLAADVEGDRLWGLGSADMKGGVAAMLVTAARVAATGSAGRLSLVLTADEENASAFGTHHIAPLLPLEADGVVIGEPGGLQADFDRLHLVSRGICRTFTTATGRQGHSSLSGEPGTRNAGLDVARAVAALPDAAVALPPNPDGLSGWTTTVNPGLRYDGGVGFGVLPGAVSALTEVRTLPGSDRDQVLAALSSAARTGAGEAADVAVTFDAEPYAWLPATQVRTTHPLAVAAAAACREVLGRAPEFSVFPGTTDATWFAGARGWPVLPALGPGLLRRAHGADEWVSVSALRTAVELYSRLATEFCRG